MNRQFGRIGRILYIARMKPPSYTLYIGNPSNPSNFGRASVADAEREHERREKRMLCKILKIKTWRG
jgi:hypothetical protein